MAGGIVLLALMTLILPWQIIIPIHGLVQLISNSTRCWFLKDHIKKDFFFYFCLGAPLGMVVAVYLLVQLPHPKFFMGLLTLSIFYVIFKPKKLPPLVIPSKGFIGVGFLVGFFGPLIGATGPFLASFFLRDDFDKKEIVATKAAVQMMGHLVKIPAFAFLAFPYTSYAPLIIGMSLAAIVGTKVGVVLLGKINEKLFRILYKLALFGAVCRLIYQIIFN